MNRPQVRRQAPPLTELSSTRWAPVVSASIAEP